MAFVKGQKSTPENLKKNSQIFGYFPFRYDQVPSDRILRKRFYLASLQATDRAVHFARLALGKTISGIVKYKYKFQIINDNDSEADLNQLNKEEERVKNHAYQAICFCFCFFSKKEALKN